MSMTFERAKRVTKPAEDRRREILDAAVSVFSAKGLAGATMDDIARQAGVAKGTIYLYFETKEHLLASLRERFHDTTIRRVEHLLAESGTEDRWALADLLVEASIDFLLEHRETVAIFRREGLSPEALAICAKITDRINEMVAGVIRSGVEAGTFAVVDPAVTAVLLHHALEGTVGEEVLYRRNFGRDRLVASAKELVRKVLAPPS
jgi:AcrR family transcriptional regulator